MDPISLLKTLHLCIGTAQKLNQLLENQLSTMLGTIGDVNFKAAGRALKDLKLSEQPQREIESAITHLRAAYIAFQSIERPTSEENCKCISALCIISICYRHLGERKLQNEYILISEKVLKQWKTNIDNDEEYLQSIFIKWSGRIALSFMNRKYSINYDSAHSAWSDFVRLSKY